MYEIAGRKIFAKNIRGYLGENTDINKSMKYTIEKEPHNFWYFNNVLCSNNLTEIDICLWGETHEPFIVYNGLYKVQS